MVNNRPPKLTTDFPDYYAIGSGQNDTTESSIVTVVPISGTFKNLIVRMHNNNQTADTVFTMRKNEADTPLTLTFATGVTGTKTDLVNSFPVVLGDRIVLEADATAGSTTTADVFSFSLEFVPD